MNDPHQTSTPDITQAKQILRQSMLVKRQAMASTARLEAARAMALHFADHPYLTYAKSFAGYYAFRGECDVLPIFNHMQRFHKQTALPRIDAETQRLSFHVWAPGQPLQDHALGMREPPKDHATLVPEVVLVPLLAFDLQGNRLGYGGGYYDRTIAQLREAESKPPLFVGVGFAVQECAEVPADAQDQPLDGILTEAGASFFSHG